MNDIKNENERLTLPFVPEAVIVGNGDFPSHPFPLAVLDQAPCVVCCDGAANTLADSGRVPDWIVGDGDSLSEENRIRFHDRIHHIPDQETNDQTKAVMFLLSQGIKRIVLVGATGKREDHTLGNISLLMEYQQMGAEVVMLTDYGFFIPATGDKVFAGFPRQQVSVFNFGAIQLRSEGLNILSMIFTLCGKVRLMKWNTAVSALQQKEVTWCIAPTSRRPKKRKCVLFKTSKSFTSNASAFGLKRPCVFPKTYLCFPEDLFLSDF